MKTKNAFTLLEMMIVLLIITIILLITLPNITQKETIIRERLKSLLSVIDSQILLYQIEKDEVPSIQDLINDGYLKEEQAKCPNGKSVEIINGQATSQ